MAWPRMFYEHTLYSLWPPLEVGTDVFSLNIPLCCHISLPYTTKSLHQNNPPKKSNHAWCCHYCNIDFVLFHNAISYNDSLLSCIHVNITCLLTSTCTLVATCMILGSLECIDSDSGLEIPTYQYTTPRLHFLGTMYHNNIVLWSWETLKLCIVNFSTKICDFSKFLIAKNHHLVV